MPLVAASHVSMHFTGPLLLDDVTLAVEKGNRIGVIGRNGSGKTTLLKILAGKLEPTGGNVVRQRGITVDYQAQELEYTPGATAYEEMRAVFGTLPDVADDRRTSTRTTVYATIYQRGKVTRGTVTLSRSKEKHDIATLVVQ